MKQLFYSALILIFTACIGGGSGDKDKLSDSRQKVDSQEFFSKLKERANKGVMLGHQDALAYGSMWFGDEGRSDVKSLCGDYPAVVGWDIGNIELGLTLNVDSIEFSKIKEYVQAVDEMGGVSTISWTTNNPADDNQNSVSLILENEQYRQTYLSYLDRLSQFFRDIKNKKGKSVPFVFRPLYDPNLPDHWWSIAYCTKEEYKKLWVMTVDYLRKEKKIDNVLFAFSLYNPLSLDEFMTFYPGDEYVDIIGSSLYLEQETDPDGKRYSNDLNRNLSLITDISGKRNKIPALTDTGMEGIKIPNYFSNIVNPVLKQYPVSYVLFGKNAWNIEEHYHIPIPGHPASEDFLEFVKSPNILTSSKLGNNNV